MALIVVVFWLHFIADFVLQSNTMSTNKSKDNRWLLAHVGVYAAVFLLMGWQYALVNAVLHGCVDFFTSRLTARYWLADRRHAFFVTIGADQAIHMTCLYLTLRLVDW